MNSDRPRMKVAHYLGSGKWTPAIYDPVRDADLLAMWKTTFRDDAAFAALLRKQQTELELLQRQVGVANAKACFNFDKIQRDLDKGWTALNNADEVLRSSEGGKGLPYSEERLRSKERVAGVQHTEAIGEL
ncbi:hypothetical protein EUX98_g4904 [Antrodiella citrinella]|uniref:Uncharacterized protein n=1 Tax=Antrodiella citrinella TaxID=2447956 RepID=A0A4S4MUN8_9APHY|nr:hypothetical protein EUX98_g4904 [Antrodiella citrinella]